MTTPANPGNVSFSTTLGSTDHHPKVIGLKDFKQPEQDHIRHCKIVGTLGPASSNEEVLRELIKGGLNIARLNFSHGTHEQHKRNLDMVRRIAHECDRHVAILQDLQGPKIRAGRLLGDSIELVTGKIYTLAYGLEQTSPDVIPIDYRELVHDVKVGQRVLMDDGLLSLQIESLDGPRVIVRVLAGGILKSRKGVNFPDSKLSLPALTEKDSRDLLFGISHGVDYVALSFVQTADDVIKVKRMISALGSDVPVVAKIEKLSAIEEIDDICSIADGLMVARGDLGVEGCVERVPGFQKRIIEAAARKAKPVIIATQMLESMIENPSASIAEMADVANGVLDGADCLMLSGEVASGKYPVACVKTMVSIIQEVEKWTFKHPSRYGASSGMEKVADTASWTENEAIARAACEAADELGAKAIVCLTLTGSIARSISKWRPKTPIVAISPRRDVIQRLIMVWGVYGMQNPLFYNTDTLLQDLPNLLKQLGLVSSGDTIVITSGTPINQMKPTNSLKINRIP
jgi:pyruvate kinase